MAPPKFRRHNPYATYIAQRRFVNETDAAIRSIRGHLSDILSDIVEAESYRFIIALYANRDLPPRVSAHFPLHCVGVSTLRHSVGA